MSKRDGAMIVFVVKTIFLIGILSWYSATIFSMINDYFRREFNEHIKIDSPPRLRPSPSLPPDPYKSNTIQPISSNHKLDVPQFNSTSVTVAAAADDDEKRSPAMMTSNTIAMTEHSNQQNNKILSKHPLIPIIIITTAAAAADEDEDRLVYADNGRCHFGEYAVQLLSGNPVCMRRR